MSRKVRIHKLAKNILDAHPYGYYGALLKGKKGTGKSTYCIHVAAQVYYLLSRLPDEERYIHLEKNISYEEAYHIALDHTKFKLNDIIKTLRSLRGALRDTRKMCPCVIWDDAGVYAGSGLYHEDRSQESKVRKYNNIIRTRCTGWLINTPVVSGLTTALRKTDDVVITITDNSGEKNIDEQGRDKTINKYRRLATGVIKKERSRWGKTVIRDDFRCRLPYKSVHSRYIDMKEEAFEETEDTIGEVDV